MTDSEILKRISAIVAGIVGVDDLALEPSTTAGDVDGWDSVAHVQIVVALEHEFGIRFRASEMASMINVSDLLGRIALHLRSPKT